MLYCHQPKSLIFWESTALKPFSILSKGTFVLQIAAAESQCSLEFREGVMACLRSMEEEGKGGFPPCNLLGALWANTLACFVLMVFFSLQQR